MPGSLARQATLDSKHSRAAIRPPWESTRHAVVQGTSTAIDLGPHDATVEQADVVSQGNGHWK